MKKIFLILVGLSIFLWANDSRFTRDANGIITDNHSHLQWQDDYADNGNTIKTANWIDAIMYCEALSLDNGGWRLPNNKELLSIIDYNRHNPAISSVFTMTASYAYWTSTTYVHSTEFAWYINFNRAGTRQIKKTDMNNVRCVRTGQ